ncbi:MAG: N-acetylneuraminate synthase family protein [bacterium]|nr:N-acetylneuraminate synthase family protein [bacterium]
MTVKIRKNSIGKNSPCFIIAEAGVNHNGDIGLAKKLIEAAKTAGADAVKFQTFKSEEIVTPDAGQAEYQIKNIGKEESQYAMLKRLELPYQAFRELKEYCDRVGIIFLSTPHSCKEDVDLVAELCPAIKIGSGDLTNLPILKYIAGKKLPVILSTGMADLEEVREAVETILPDNEEVILLHCTTNYPTPLNEVNLRAMETMEREFNLPVGYSDHTTDVNVPALAVALGACVIEKHFTLDRNLPGPDHKASLEPQELKAMVGAIRNTEERLRQGKSEEKIIAELNVSEALGDGVKNPNPSEIEVAKVARKSIVAAADIPKGKVITEEMLAIKRPGTGLPSRELAKVLGRIAKNDIRKNVLIKYEDLDQN